MAQRDPGQRSPALRPVIAESWGRCTATRAGRDGSHLPRIRLTGDALTGYRERHTLAELLPLCRDLLGDAVRESGCIFALADARGALLWVEGDPGTRSRIERIHFVEGAVWSEDIAGTNAPGTALAVGAPVQIRTVEHFNEAVREWSCTAAPIRDPDSGRFIGVLDVTGGPAAAEAPVLAAVRATSRLIEAELARAAAVRDARARTAYDQASRPSAGAAALVSPGGRVLVATPGLGITRITGMTTAGDGSGQLVDGRRLLIEPVGVGGYLVVRFLDDSVEPQPCPPLRLSVLGSDTSLLEIDGRSLRLGPRRSEILMLLALTPDGLSTSRLAAALSRSPVNPTSLRVDMSRLRTLVGEQILASRPYRLCRPVHTDAGIVDDLLAQGRVGEALVLYRGPVLPHSRAPEIERVRTALHERLRAAVLASHDAILLQRWVETPWGAQDAEGWRILGGLAPEGSACRDDALRRAESLRVAAPSS